MRFNTTSKRSFPEENRILQTIPGVNENCAATILAEIGPTVTAFPSDAHLASWAGLCPGSYESAGIKKSSHITQGNRYIKQALTCLLYTSGSDCNHRRGDYVWFYAQ